MDELAKIFCLECGECGYKELEGFYAKDVRSMFCVDDIVMCEDCYWAWREKRKGPYIIERYSDNTGLDYVKTFDSIFDIVEFYKKYHNKLWFYGSRLMSEYDNGDPEIIGYVWNCDPKESGLDYEELPSYIAVRLD